MCQRGKAQGALPQDAVQALDVALKNGASNHPDCVTLPRAFFFYDPAVVKPVGGGAEVCISSTLLHWRYRRAPSDLAAGSPIGHVIHQTHNMFSIT